MPADQIAAENEATVKNLIAAFEGESNAHAKYVAFAVKAEAEDLPGAASLFRAAARAEQIHANNHARVIRQLGSGPVAEIHPVTVKSTLENLKVALAGEQYEIDSMYPDFIAEAKTHNNTAAIRTFERAMEAEITHARLYSEAIKLLESAEEGTWLAAPRNFYVCPACGYTSEEREGEHCPVCNYIWERFEVVR
jgi:rubrerythrin